MLEEMDVHESIQLRRRWALEAARLKVCEAARPIVGVTTLQQRLDLEAAVREWLKLEATTP